MSDDINLKAATTLISALGDRVPTEDDIRARVEPVIHLMAVDASDADELIAERIVRLVLARVNVLSPASTVLEDNTDHVPWLRERRSDVEAWPFWDRYRVWLETSRHRPKTVVNRLDEISDNILGRLEDPHRAGAWDRRGLVVGQVQSGKTENYTALICKAADAGYKVVVVLAGIHNSLRAQTQHRLDAAFLGLDSLKKRPFGVGSMFSSVGPRAIALTDRGENGDFSLSHASAATLQLGSAPLLVVVKKNTGILRNLLGWLTSLNRSPALDGRDVIKDLPLLLVDDEADYASINTADPEHDPTRTNHLIREILTTFEKSAYVGYTATPFANLFISETVKSEEIGRDLFPRNFIVALRPPSDYVGPAKFFGLDGPPASEKGCVDGLPLIRTVSDHELWVPDHHKKDLVPGPLPLSLKRAVQSFVLACSARRARGQLGHNSMLVHVTRFVDVQEKVHEQISDYVAEIKRSIRYGPSDDPLLVELQRVWDDDLEPTTIEMVRSGIEGVDPSECLNDWADVVRTIRSAIERVEVKQINGTSGDALDYENHEQGLSVIAVGGDKLSRGLTLEGLSVSYYLRASRMYDTLMQMGRWFGYRPGYLDVCRLYTSSELIGWYRDIATATEELWADFESMAQLGETPESYGLKVRRHPSGLLVTAATKMRHGERRSLSFSGVTAETTTLLLDDDVRRVEFEAVEHLASQLGDPSDRETMQHLVWKGVGYEDVTDFFGQLSRKSYENNRRARPDLMREYVLKASREGELLDWTVAIVHNSQVQKADQITVAGRGVGMTFRNHDDASLLDQGIYRIGRLADPDHEGLDLTDEERELALRKTKDLYEAGKTRFKSPPESPSGPMVRAARSPRRGLIIIYLLKAPDGGQPMIGYLVSFPVSMQNTAVDYVVNNVYIQQELEIARDA